MALLEKGPHTPNLPLCAHPGDGCSASPPCFLPASRAYVPQRPHPASSDPRGLPRASSPRAATGDGRRVAGALLPGYADVVIPPRRRRLAVPSSPPPSRR